MQLADNAIRHSLRRQVDHRAPVLGLAHAVRRLHREIGFSNAPNLKGLARRTHIDKGLDHHMGALDG